MSFRISVKNLSATVKEKRTLLCVRDSKVHYTCGIKCRDISLSTSTNCSDTRIEPLVLPRIRFDPNDKVHRGEANKTFTDCSNKSYDRVRKSIYLRKSFVLQNLIESYSEYQNTHRIIKTGSMDIGDRLVGENFRYEKEFEDLFKEDFKANHFNLNKKLNLAKARLRIHKTQKMKALQVLNSS